MSEPKAAGLHDDASIKVRTATPLGAQSIAEIYGEYVAETAITFEVQVPTASEMAERIMVAIEGLAERDASSLVPSDHLNGTLQTRSAAETGVGRQERRLKGFGEGNIHSIPSPDVPPQLPGSFQQGPMPEPFARPVA